jgi:ABC-type transport system involved in multi-copper enzyme maturation permease subunit
MNQLVVRNKAQEFVSRSLGGLLLLSVGLQLFIYSPKRPIFWLLAVIFVLAAILFFTMFFGVLISRLTSDAGVLTIRWNTKIFKKHVRIDEIAEITDDKRFIRIRQKNGKTIRLPVRLMEPDKRNAVRKFLKETTGF